MQFPSDFTRGPARPAPRGLSCNIRIIKETSGFTVGECHARMRVLSLRNRSRTYASAIACIFCNAHELLVTEDGENRVMVGGVSLATAAAVLVALLSLATAAIPGQFIPQAISSSEYVRGRVALCVSERE